MRLPNGFGGISNLGGNRRKPYRVRVTSGWTPEGKQIYKTLGYFASQQEAYAALLEYHDDPLAIDNKKITLGEVFERWSKLNYETMGKQSILSYNMAYNYIKHLNDKPFVQIKSDHIRTCIKKCPKGKNTKLKIKGLFNQLYNWGLENDLVDKNYSQFVKVESTEEDDNNERIPFTYEEIKLLWDNLNIEYMDTILIMLYSGIRIKELEILKTENVNLKEKWFKTGVKTASGKNRIIPIHDKVLPLFEKRYDPNNEYFLTRKGKKMSYSSYRTNAWDIIMEYLNLKHLPHDTRHTFVSEMARKGVKELRIQRIIGHSNENITQHYTHTELNDLSIEINKLTYE